MAVRASAFNSPFCFFLFNHITNSTLKDVHVPFFKFLDTIYPAQVQEVRWWMASYGADTPKRHVCYSNSVQIKKLDKGRLQGWKRRSGKKVKTVEHYRDSTGKRRWKGTKALRATEFLGLIYIQICWGQ